MPEQLQILFGGRVIKKAARQSLFIADVISNSTVSSTAMALRLFNRNPREDVTGELCLEPEGIALMRESETIEQKVTQIFQALRLPVYYYLMAFLGDAATADDLTQ